MDGEIPRGRPSKTREEEIAEIEKRKYRRVDKTKQKGERGGGKSEKIVK